MKKLQNEADAEREYEKIKELYQEKKYKDVLKRLDDIDIENLPEKHRWEFFEVKGMCEINSLQIAEGVENMRKALFSPLGMPLLSQRRIASNYCIYLHYLDNISDRDMYEVHALYNQLFPLNKHFPHTKRKRDKIRIGYISPNFVKHIVMNFVIQLFSAYDRDRFEVYLYQTGGKHDEVSDWLMTMTDGWRELAGLDANEAANRIYEDKIDILFDLAGHTEGGETLQICAYKPAPVQLCGIGWFDTTGLSAIDYFLSDIYCDPPENDALFTEKLLRLPHSHFCYTPPETVLKCNGEYHVHSPIVFGSFNNFDKITDEMLRVWKRILERVPGSKLLLKNVQDSMYLVELMKQRLLNLGFQKEEIDVRPGTLKYLNEYMDMDIALDTYPYPGGGTTCEALYMGVPVVSLYGQRHGSRFGYSLLNNTGLGELAAASEDEYVRIAVTLARDRELLKGLHTSLRQMMQKSSVMNAQGYVREAEEAYEKIWKDWLNTQK